jgi:hypothetical protein
MKKILLGLALAICATVAVKEAGAQKRPSASKATQTYDACMTEKMNRGMDYDKANKSCCKAYGDSAACK